jgi:hypothetical protein
MSAVLNTKDFTVAEFFDYNRALEADDQILYVYLNRITKLPVEELESLNVRQFFGLVGAISKEFTGEIENPTYDTNSVAVDIDKWRVKDYRAYTKAMQEQDFDTVYQKLEPILNKNEKEIQKMPFRWFAAVMNRITKEISDEVNKGK